MTVTFNITKAMHIPHIIQNFTIDFDDILSYKCDKDVIKCCQ